MHFSDALRDQCWQYPRNKNINKSNYAIIRDVYRHTSIELEINVYNRQRLFIIKIFTLRCNTIVLYKT